MLTTVGTAETGITASVVIRGVNKASHDDGDCANEYASTRWCLTTGDGAKDATSRQDMFIRLDENVVEQLTMNALEEERRTCYMYVGNTKQFSIQNGYWNIYAQVQNEQQQQLLPSASTSSSTTLFSILFGDGGNIAVSCEDETTSTRRKRVQFLPLELKIMFENAGGGTNTTTAVVSYGSYNGGLFLSQTTMAGPGTSTSRNDTVMIDIPPSLLLDCSSTSSTNRRTDAVVTTPIITTESTKMRTVPTVKEVQIRALPYVKNATSISLEPLSTQDWEWLELFATELEQGALLQQISIVYPNQIFPVRIESSYIKETAWVKVLLDDSFSYLDSDDEDDEKKVSMSLSDKESFASGSDDYQDDAYLDSGSMESSSLDSLYDDFSPSSCSSTSENEDGSNNKEENDCHRQCVEDESDGAANEENDATNDHDMDSDGDEEYKVWEWRKMSTSTNDHRRRLCRKRRRYHKCLRLVADTEVIVTPKPRQVNKKEPVKDSSDQGEGDISSNGWSLSLNVVPPHEVSYLSEFTWYERWLCDDMLNFVTNKIEKRRSSNKDDDADTILRLRSIADQLNYRQYCFNDTMIDPASSSMTQKTFCCADTGTTIGNTDKKNGDEGIINTTKVDTTTTTCPHCGKPRRHRNDSSSHQEAAPAYTVWMSRSTFDQCFGSASSTSNIDWMDDSSMRRKLSVPAKVRLFSSETNKNERCKNNKGDMESIKASVIVVDDNYIEEDGEQLLYKDGDVTVDHHLTKKKKKKNSSIVYDVVLSPSLYRALFAKQATTTRDDDDDDDDNASTSTRQIQLLLLNKDLDDKTKTKGRSCNSNPLPSLLDQQEPLSFGSNWFLTKNERTILLNVFLRTCSSRMATLLMNQHHSPSTRRRKPNIKRSPTATDSGKRRTVVPHVQCLLLSGQEGTGKTHMCHLIATMLKCTTKYVDCQRLQTSYQASKGGMTYLLDELSRIFDLDTVTSGDSKHSSSNNPSTKTTQENKLDLIILDDLDVLIPNVGSSEHAATTESATSHQQGQISPQLIHQTKLLANHLAYLIRKTRTQRSSANAGAGSSLSVIILATIKSANLQRPSLHKALICHGVFEHVIGALPSTLSLKSKQDMLRRMVILKFLNQEEHLSSLACTSNTTGISTTSATSSTITMIDMLVNSIDPELFERSTEGYRAKDLECLASNLLHEMQQQQQQMTSTRLSSSAESRNSFLNRDQVLNIWNRAMKNMTPLISSASQTVSGGASSNELSSTTNAGTLTRPTGGSRMTLDTHVGGLFALKQELLECIEHPLKYSLLYQKSPINLPKGFMLFGPSGCGKTFVVKALANQLSLPLLLVKGPELFSKYIGQSEGNVRRVFERVYQVASAASGAMLCLDELDALAPKRGTDNTGVTDRVVNQLLTFLDGVETNFVSSDDYDNIDDETDDDDENKIGNTNKDEPQKASSTIPTRTKQKQNVYIIGVTSRPDKVDAALLRPGRLEKHLFVGPPAASVEEHSDVFSKLLLQRITTISSVDDDVNDKSTLPSSSTSQPSVVVELDEETQNLLESGTFLSHLFEQDSNLKLFTPADYKAAIDSAYLRAIHEQYLSNETYKDSSSKTKPANDNGVCDEVNKKQHVTRLVLTKQLLIDSLRNTKPSSKSVTKEEQFYLEGVYNQFRGITMNSNNNNDNSNDHHRRRLPEGTFL